MPQDRGGRRQYDPDRWEHARKNGSDGLPSEMARAIAYDTPKTKASPTRIPESIPDCKTTGVKVPQVESKFLSFKATVRKLAALRLDDGTDWTRRGSLGQCLIDVRNEVFDGLDPH